MWKKIAAPIVLVVVTIGILTGAFLYVLNSRDNSDLNPKETDVYQEDRMMQNQEEMSPPYQDQDGSVSGAAKP
ncbi:hypothetical protein [Paenibacillus glacialis]|uniref:Uncharacterized protein n=1 Tax=Paenibacillus glacialis TaxID=494026 RepID=A0A168ELQ7_9BACL|nr:hypothetical protein [Paenibacillus glacialis]OAB35314.1 hypothetical protein PGLA_22180 [Paenibacillus glacialis]